MNDDDKTVPGEAESPGLHTHKVERTVTSVAWTAVALVIVVVAALIVFISQNLSETRVHFLAWHASLPVAVALIASALAGAFIVLVVGVLRIFQLRRVATRHSHDDQRQLERERHAWRTRREARRVEERQSGRS